MVRSLLLTFTAVTLLTGCATIPLPGKGVLAPQSVRPVKSLIEGREGTLTQNNPDSKRKSAALVPDTRGKSTAPLKPGQPIPDSTIASQIQNAEDKAASARSLTQSAQTEDDWNLVAQQWTRAIALLPTTLPNSPLADKVQQIRSRYTADLQSAQSQAQGSGKPKPIAPIEVDGRSSGQRGFVLGEEATPSPSPSTKSSEKPIETPKSNPTPSPSPKK